MSVVSTCAINAYSGVVARIAAARIAWRRPNARSAKTYVASIPAIADSATGMRAANSETPKIQKEKRGQPVKQRRLLDVRDVVEMRHQQVAALQHLARNLGVARLVGLPQTE